mgnify:CR=1 FL=1
MTHVSPQCGWLLQTWGEEAVAYDAASGDTHYLSPFTLALYEICRDHAGLGAADISPLLAAQLPHLPEAELRDAIDLGLASLSRIGLLQAS